MRSANIVKWCVLAILCATLFVSPAAKGGNQAVSEAPTGFDDGTNGLVDQATHDADRIEFFQEVDTEKSGLGPLANGNSCAQCHAAPKSGGSSQVTELRVGHVDSSGYFVNPTIPMKGGGTISGRSLVNQIAICPKVEELVPDTETIRTLRASVNTLGDGFVEAIDDSTLVAIAKTQSAQSGGTIQGQVIMVPVLESPGAQAVGRFGWKDQQASLLSFAADAYINEQGITNRLFPDETTTVCDRVQDPEDPIGAGGLADIDHLAQFIRAAKAPPVDALVAAQPDAQTGSKIFDAIGCGICHIRSLRTAPPGTVIKGGTFTVPDALGNKIIHPFSDFLLHNVGTGDGIVQNGGEPTAYKLRTAPLWGLRTRSKLMHDGASGTLSAAILRHAGEATSVMKRYRGLSPLEKEQLIKFLSSL